MTEPSIAVVGATGMVGTCLLSILDEGWFPVREIRLCASERSVGTGMKVLGETIAVEPVSDEVLKRCDLVFISANTEISRRVAPRAVELGAVAIDDSSAFRMDPSVPLVVPEVNGGELDRHRGIISIPNCTTTPLVMVLAALGDLAPIRRVVVSTYQSVSGTGTQALLELWAQTETLLDDGETNPEVYPHTIAFNLFPQVGDFAADGYAEEEIKIREETRKILGRPDLPISATCVRVPVMIGHCESVQIEMTSAVDPEAARERLSASRGIAVVDEPEMHRYPTPAGSTGQDEVHVGRIRADSSHPQGLALWLACDNLRKGAALNALQIADQLLRRDILRWRRHWQ